MLSKRLIVLVLVSTLIAVGCSTQQTPAPTTTTTGAVSVTDVSTKVDNVVSKGLYRFGPTMMGVSDSFDNMYFAAKGGNWALADYMGDVMDDFMSPTQLTKATLYTQWAAFYKSNFGDGTPIKKAVAAKDFAAFDTAYSNTIANMCNGCHTSNKFQFIKKIKATSPAVDLDYTVKSDASENS